MWQRYPKYRSLLVKLYMLCVLRIVYYVENFLVDLYNFISSPILGMTDMVFILYPGWK